FCVSSFVSVRWLYFWLRASLALVVAGGTSLWHRRRDGSRQVLVAVVAVVVVGFFAATWLRAGLFSDEEKLWRDVVIQDENSWAGHFNLARTLERRPERDATLVKEIFDNYRAAMRIRPDRPESFNNLGDLYREQGQPDDA